MNSLFEKISARMLKHVKGTYSPQRVGDSPCFEGKRFQGFGSLRCCLIICLIGLVLLIFPVQANEIYLDFFEEGWNTRQPNEMLCSPNDYQAIFDVGGTSFERINRNSPPIMLFFDEEPPIGFIDHSRETIRQREVGQQGENVFYSLVSPSNSFASSGKITNVPTSPEVRLVAPYSSSLPASSPSLPLENQWKEHDVRPWKWQILPAGLIYPSYLAGRKEPRLGCEFAKEIDGGGVWDITLGGRVPLLRFGTAEAVFPEGWQIDLEGAAILRLDLARHREMAGTDYRAGMPITYGKKYWQLKTGYYHISSHLGDNYLLGHVAPQINYVRDELIVGLALRPIDAVRLYGEIGWAFKTGITTKPWEVQFGVEYSKPYSPENQQTGSPFAAINVHLFEELDFSGSFNCQTGWQWRGPVNNLFRLGVEYYSGNDELFQFHFTCKRKFGFGIWYDF